MTSAVAGIAIAALVLFGTTQTPQTTQPAPTAQAVEPQEPTPAAPAAQLAAEPTGPGQRVQIDSFTAPPQVARCIAYNINRKMPELRVRHVAGESPEESGYLVLTVPEPAPTTFGVIRIERSEEGSRLTTWLPGRQLAAAPEDIARRLVAGC